MICIIRSNDLINIQSEMYNYICVIILMLFINTLIGILNIIIHYKYRLPLILF